MKKVLSFILALCVMLSSGIVAFAAEERETDKVMKQMEGAVAYLTKDAESYGVDDALDYYTLVNSGIDMSKYDEGFIADVKKNLDENSGKIVSSYGESLATYGAVLLTLDLLGEDVTDFYGYDITKAFTAMDPTTPQYSSYYYRVIIPATLLCSDNAFAKAVCDTFISNNYEMGKGMPVYGYYSSDNTAYFINALAPYAEDYPEVMQDAFAVLDNYEADGGYFCDPAFGTEANTDSTALVLMAYSSVLFSVPEDKLDGYLEKTKSIYDKLCTFEGSGTGIFISSYTQEDDAYATKEALMGLEEYYYVALFSEVLKEEPTDSTDVTAAAAPTTAPAASPSKAPAKSPNTGAELTAMAYAAAISLLGATAYTLRKKK